MTRRDDEEQREGERYEWERDGTGHAWQLEGEVRMDALYLPPPLPDEQRIQMAPRYADALAEAIARTADVARQYKTLGVAGVALTSILHEFALRLDNVAWHQRRTRQRLAVAGFAALLTAAFVIGAVVRGQLEAAAAVAVLGCGLITGWVFVTHRLSR